jgi:hypothetical protein
MIVGPGKDFVFDKRRQVLQIALTTELLQQLCQRLAAWQTAQAARQAHVDVHPLFVRRLVHRAAGDIGPLARTLMMGIRPLKQL